MSLMFNCSQFTFQATLEEHIFLYFNNTFLKGKKDPFFYVQEELTSMASSLSLGKVLKASKRRCYHVK